ncbi:MAG: PAS domain-containing protein, partial [Pseudanabaenaceae cyanobacterium]
MGVGASKFEAFDLLQTPVWIIYNREIWYANRAASSLVNDSSAFADLPGPDKHREWILTVEETSYICYLTDIEIEEGKNALLVEACLDPRHALLLEASPDGVMIADFDTGKIVQANSKACSLTSKQPDELIGLHHSQLYSEEQREFAASAFRSLIGGWCTGLTIPRRDRAPVPIQIYSTFFVMGYKIYVYGFFRDLTRKKQL